MPLLKRLLLGITGVALGVCASTATAEIVAVVSATSPVKELSANQIVDIFLGKASRFPNGQPAAPIDQVEGSPAREAFYRKYASRSPAQIKAHWAKVIFTGRGQPPQVVPGITEVKKQLATNPNAIGYIDSEAVDGTVRILLSVH